MATDKYPQRNHNIPMDDGAVEAARARLNPGVSGTQGNYPNTPSDGKGSRRQIRPGEWVDDRVINIGGPASPSSVDDPSPEWKKSDRALPTFDPAKVYQVTLGKSCIFAGRVLSPSMSFQMTGDTCLDPNVQPCIVDAVELGPVPQDPDAPPSEGRSEGRKSKKA